MNDVIKSTQLLDSHILEWCVILISLSHALFHKQEKVVIWLWSVPLFFFKVKNLNVMFTHFQQNILKTYWRHDKFNSFMTEAVII